MRVIFLTEGGTTSGVGHITRCFALYEAIKEHGNQVKMYVNTEIKVDTLIGDVGINYDWITHRSEISQIILKYDVLIIDSYKANISIYRDFAKLVTLVIYIDDYQRLHYPKGIVVNGSILAENLQYPRNNQIHLLGVKYMPLRKEFWDTQSISVRKNIQAIMLTFGGEDRHNMTQKIAKWINIAYPEIKLHIVIGHSYQKIQEIKKLDSNNNIIFYCPDAKTMKSIMLKSDITISAGGQTLYELARCGIPTIAISTARNQENNVKGWLKAGFIEFAGWWEDRNLLKNISNKIDILKDLKEREKRSAIAKKLIDGRGAERIASLIKKTFEYKEAH